MRLDIRLSDHAISLIPTERERFHRFMKDLVFSIRFYVFKLDHEGASFQIIVSTAKEVELIVREAFRDLKMD